MSVGYCWLGIVFVAACGTRDSKSANTEAQSESPPAILPAIGIANTATLATKVMSERETAEWWTPPPGERTDVEALAYGFASDENDLGSVFDGALKLIRGAPNLFESQPPRRVAVVGKEPDAIEIDL